MIKSIALFVGSFALCAVIGSTGTGCLAMGGDCNCPEIPDFPAAKLARPAVITLNGQPTPPVYPDDVTLEVKGTTAVVRYVKSGANIEVLYTLDRYPY